MKGFLLLTTMSRLAPGPTQSPIQWEPGCEADQSPQSSAKVKNPWIYTSTPCFFMVWGKVKHRNCTWDDIVRIKANFSFQTAKFPNTSNPMIYILDTRCSLQINGCGQLVQRIEALLNFLLQDSDNTKARHIITQLCSHSSCDSHRHPFV